MKSDAIVLNERELRYVLRLVAEDHLEKKRKSEKAKRQFEKVDAFFRRATDVILKIEEERIEQAEEKEK